MGRKRIQSIGGVLATVSTALLTPAASSAQSGTATVQPAESVSISLNTVGVWRASEVSLAAMKGSYLLIAAITPDHKVRIVYPASPLRQVPFAERNGRRRFYIYSRTRFTETGKLYGFASAVPFDFSKVSEGKLWTTERLSTPAVLTADDAASSLLSIVLPAGVEYAVAQAPYYVQSSENRIGSPSTWPNYARPGIDWSQGLQVAEFGLLCYRSNGRQTPMGCPVPFVPLFEPPPLRPAPQTPPPAPPPVIVAPNPIHQ